ncbi:uncharacterized protein LOC131429231 [Malaya genurostris]|uniref:uncharacterized protein LOC131429231 n=1 Tax=Malaya genurostris TaxID=325434 RepID=UPI0026F3F8FC|nr:uncharacterized protein LOC131429231 [Malaya genurostris]
MTIGAIAEKKLFHFVFPLAGTLEENYWLAGWLQSDERNEYKIWVYYQNVRGLRTKIDELFLAVCDCNYDIIILTETGLDDRINSQQLFGNAFNVFRCDRSLANSVKSKFGGVLVAVSQKYASSVVQTVNGRCLEQVCVCATVRDRKIFLCGVYIPPDKSQQVGVIDEHISTVSELCSKSSASDIVFVCGDFNQPRITWGHGSNVTQSPSLLPVASTTLIDGMDYLNLYQRNRHKNHLGRTLDLIFCSLESQLVVDRCVAPLLPVDLHHPPLAVSLPVDCESVSCDTQLIVESMPLNYRKIDFTAFQAYLQDVNWSVLYEIDNVNEMSSLFCDILFQWLSSNLPLAKRPIATPWTTAYLRKLKRDRNAWQRKHRRFHNAETQRMFKHSSESYRKLNARLYKDYVMRVQTDLRRNPKKFWTFVNSKRKCSSIPPNVCLDGVESNSTVDSCELFATFFASVFAGNTASDAEADVAAMDVPENLVRMDTFIITPEMILAAAKKLKKSYSAGPDGIPAAVYTNCTAALAEPLCIIFNKSFEQGIFPEIWKQSFMFPVFKSGDRRNYPIRSKVGGHLLHSLSVSQSFVITLPPSSRATELNLLTHVCLLGGTDAGLWSHARDITSCL